ncbi:MAG TPA: hypothetical protein VK468_09520 [Pyrinomonadaceae bacterium]|nr:hypothetical protein [Pyrinomonadaceae bacterium]
MKNVRKLALFSLMAVTLLPILVIGTCEYRARSLANGFNKIQVGDSRETVFELMGKPETRDIEQCKYQQDCKNSYFYLSFMERLIITVVRTDTAIEQANSLFYGKLATFA